MQEFDQLVADARAAYARGDWRATYDRLCQARILLELSAEDLSLLGSAAWCLGQVKESVEISEYVYHRLYNDGDCAGAAMKALDVGLVWFIRGDMVIASGWISRARRILQELPKGLERGYLIYVDATLAFKSGDLALARDSAATLQELGHRLRTPALTSFSLVLAGLSDLSDGKTASGLHPAGRSHAAGHRRPSPAGMGRGHLLHRHPRLPYPRRPSTNAGVDQGNRAVVRAATSEQIADASNLNERYVRQWLSGMSVAQVLLYDAGSGTYQLPREHGAVITSAAGPNNMAILMQHITMMGDVEQKIIECFRRGGGLSYSDYLLADAGFRDVECKEVEADAFNSYFIARKQEGNDAG